MNGFSLSAPTDALLRAAEINPVRLNKVFDERVVRRLETILRPSHPYLVQVRQRTGVPLMMVLRRRRHLLIEIESQSPFWRYREYSRLDCQLLIRCSVPETIVSAAPGERLGRIVGGMPYLELLLIKEAFSMGNLLELKVEPNWRRVS